MSNLYKMPQARHQERVEEELRQTKELLKWAELDLKAIIDWLNANHPGSAQAVAIKSLRRLQLRHQHENGHDEAPRRA